MQPQELATLIVAIFGVLLQLVLRYAPRVSAWYNAQENKGLIAVALSAIIGGALVALACTPYAADLGVTLSCEQSTIFVYLRAIFIIATSQQLTYLYTRGGAKPATA